MNDFDDSYRAMPVGVIAASFAVTMLVDFMPFPFDVFFWLPELTALMLLYWSMHHPKGKWAQLKGKAKEKWGELTNDDLDVIEGKRDQLAGKIQERYGRSKEEAEKEVDDWLNEN